VLPMVGVDHWLSGPLFARLHQPGSLGFLPLRFLEAKGLFCRLSLITKKVRVLCCLAANGADLLVGDRHLAIKFSVSKGHYRHKGYMTSKRDCGSGVPVAVVLAA